MKRITLVSLIAGMAGAAMAVPSPSIAADRGMAKQSIKASGGANTRSNDRRNVRQTSSSRTNTNRNSNNRRTTVANNNKINAGNTVVVNRNVDRNYHGSYNDNYYHDRWDDDDDNFFEVLGKTAVVTAGVVGTAALIGEIFEDEPDDCQQTVSNGTTYLYCNGVWYQPTMAGTNMQYVVVESPR